MTQIEDQIVGGYAGLSDKLRIAADYVLANPVEIATRSLRAVAEDSGLAPATFTRLAQALGFDGYEDLREVQRGAVGQRYTGFAERARALQERGDTPATLLDRHAAAVRSNLDHVVGGTGTARLERVSEILMAARRVLVSGEMSSRGLTDHLVYLAGFFAPNWRHVGREGVSAASALADAGPRDALLVLTLAPFASRSIRLARCASERGVQVIVVTDSHTCPALEFAVQHVLVPTASPQFFSSNAAVLAVLEALIAMLVTKHGKTAQERIAQVADLNHDLGEYWPGSPP